MIAIIDYGMGNLASVYNAFVKTGFGDIKITSDPADLRRADKLVLPGVGAFEDAMKNLRRDKLVDPILESVAAGKPFLGICLGYQLMFERSCEGGNFEGLGIMKGDVVRFDISLPVPHMGWNETLIKDGAGVFDGLAGNVYFYFDHAYYPLPSDESVIAGTTEYETVFVSAVRKGNVYGAQFHPEKSHNNGLKIISNFGKLK
ncbi:MAG: imidazole glycerol phosphate synthase subunit HisH [Brevinematales bacterium]|nr:imidazole glycerol phosphate synthase subunit HisH [Brevinematales bacterium]